MIAPTPAVRPSPEAKSIIGGVTSMVIGDVPVVIGFGSSRAITRCAFDPPSATSICKVRAGTDAPARRDPQTPPTVR